MHRTDPLDALNPAECRAKTKEEEEAKEKPLPPSRPSRPSRDTDLPAEIAAVADTTLAYLAAGPRQTPEEYARCLAQAAAIRDQFLTYVAQHPAQPHWRAAWASFRPQLVLDRKPHITVSAAHYPTGARCPPFRVFVHPG